MRVTHGGKRDCEDGCAVRAAGTAIHLLFHLQGNVRSWQKGSTPRHYFRHNIRPLHTIKQWQHLNSHRTSTYPFSLNNESEEEATFCVFCFFLLFFFFSLRWGQLTETMGRKTWYTLGSILRRTTCVFTELVAGGSNNPGQITQRSRRLRRKGSSLPKTHSARHHLQNGASSVVQTT